MRFQREREERNSDGTTHGEEYWILSEKKKSFYVPITYISSSISDSNILLVKLTWISVFDLESYLRGGTLAFLRVKYEKNNVQSSHAFWNSSISHHFFKVHNLITGGSNDEDVLPPSPEPQVLNKFFNIDIQ